MPLKRSLLILLSQLTISLSLFSQPESRLAQLEVNLPSLYISVSDLLKVIEDNGIDLSYSSSYLEMDKVLRFKSKREKLGKLLSSFLESERIVYQTDKVLLLPPRHIAISGFVYDAVSREALIGAVVYDSHQKVVGITNEFGYFNVLLPWNDRIISATFIGYLPGGTEVKTGKQTTILLNQNSVELSEVVIFPKSTGEPLSATVADMQKPGYIPTLLGGDDVISRLQDGAGVSSQALFQPLSVRNEMSDNNMVLLDGIPVYSYMHIFSLYSIFSSDAIQKATLYKGLYPAKYEGRIGAILDLRMKDGSKEKTGASVNVDMGTASATVDGPIVKGKSSFMLSARRSWFDALSLFPLSSYDWLSFSSFDLYGKVNLRFNARNQLYVSSYVGGDVFKVGSTNDADEGFVRWNNILNAVRWNHIFSDRWFMNTSLSFSMYKNRSSLDGFVSRSDSQLGNRVVNFTLISDFENRWNDMLKIMLGYKLEAATNTAPYIRSLSAGDIEAYSERQNSIKASVYGEVELLLSDRWKVNGGFNMVGYYYMKGQYTMLQPRVKVEYHPNGRTTLFTGYSRSGQQYHQITLPQMSMPFELRIPASDLVHPATADLFEVGVRSDVNEKMRLYSTVFYKKTDNLVGYRQGQDPANNIAATKPSDRIIQGKSRGWGIEVEGNYTSAAWQMSLAYTYSAAKLSYPTIDNGTFLYGPNIFPHQLKAMVAWCATKKSTFSARFSLSSGLRLSYPVYSLPAIGELVSDNTGSESYYITGYSRKRLSPSSRLDVGYALVLPGITTNSKIGLRVGINNMLGQGNVMAYTPIVDSKQVLLDAVKLSNLIPYIGLSYKF